MSIAYSEILSYLLMWLVHIPRRLLTKLSRNIEFHLHGCNALLDTCFVLVSCLVCSSSMKMEATVFLDGLHGVVPVKIQILITTPARTSEPK
jgi:hypothetical protein